MSARTATYDILAAAATNASTRIYLTLAPQETATPFIVFNIEGVDHTFTKSGVSTIDTFRIDIDCYADTLAAAETLKNQVRTALDNYTGTINGVVVDGCHYQDQEPDQDLDLTPFWSIDFQMRVGT